MGDELKALERRVAALERSMKDNAIVIWRFEDAPKNLQELSRHGGDEDWIGVLPASYEGDVPMWMTSGSKFGCCDVHEHKLPDGRLVLIGAHA